MRVVHAAVRARDHIQFGRKSEIKFGFRSAANGIRPLSIEVVGDEDFSDSDIFYFLVSSDNSFSELLMLRTASNFSLRRQSHWVLAQSRQWSPFELSTPQFARHSHNQVRSKTPLVRASLKHPLAVHAGSVSYFSSHFPGGGRGGGNGWMRAGAGMAGGAAILLGKGKYLLGALKLTKLASLGSMIFSIGTYSMFFGFPYAVGMVGLVTVHEIGHALVMYQRGIPFSPMVFMPFMGAMISMNRLPRDAYEDALVAFGGPVLGSIGAAGVAVAGHMTQSQLLFALADFGFMVNLFNLMPLGSMDGGRIAGALSPWMNVAGLGMGATLALSGQIHNPIFFLILLGGGWQTFQRFYNPGALPPNYYKITPNQRGAIGLGYVGLVGGLALAMDVNERFKKPPEVLIREREREIYWDVR